MVTKRMTVTLPSTSVLIRQFELPEDLAWFNELTLEERDEFFKGLMIVSASPHEVRGQAVESHFYHWQVAVDIAKKQGGRILDLIKIYKPKPWRTPLQHFLEIVQELRSFEAKYGMGSEEFYNKFQKARLPESPPNAPLDFFRWRVAYRSFLRMKERYSFSEEDTV
jgi:hypothetical protein